VAIPAIYYLRDFNGLTSVHEFICSSSAMMAEGFSFDLRRKKEVGMMRDVNSNSNLK